ncbi:MAG: hypothetical protein ABSH56_33085 [Bryobacteraceae bacterium]|jgi:hypothetical protein
MSDASDPAAYIAAVLTLYVDLPDTPLRASASDQWLARRFHDDNVPLRVLETALLLGSLRRLIHPADAPKLSPIRSLAYFRPVVDELRTHPAPESRRYWRRGERRRRRRGTRMRPRAARCGLARLSVRVQRGVDVSRLLLEQSAFSPRR